MKKLSITLGAALLLFFCSFSVLAQRTVHQDLNGTIPGMYVNDEIGTISGTITYHFAYKLSKEGFIERIHWNLTDMELENDRGENVKITDSGNDNYGYYWDFFNYINMYNGGIVTYDVTDGWLNSVMPVQMPTEGTFNNVAFKFIVKGKVYFLKLLVLFHMNANGDITVNVVKTFVQ